MIFSPKLARTDITATGATSAITDKAGVYCVVNNLLNF